MIIVIDDSIIANCALYRNLSFALCPCRSVTRRSASSYISSLLLYLFLPPQHTSLFSLTSRYCKYSQRLLRKYFPAAPSQRLCSAHSQREELWWSAFPLSLSCCSAPGFTPACKINRWPSPFPRQPYPLSQNRRKQKKCAASRSRGRGRGPEPFLASERGGKIRRLWSPPPAVPTCSVPLCDLWLRSEMCLAGGGLAWRRRPPRSARIMHDTSECFHDRTGGLRGGVSIRVAGANVGRRQLGV